MPFDIGPINEPPQTAVNLRKLANYLERVPGWRYRQDRWETRIAGIPVAWCAFGHAARSKLFDFRYDRRQEQFVEGGVIQSVDGLSTRVFGLTWIQTSDLFGGYVAGGRRAVIQRLRVYADAQERRARQPIAA